MTDLPRVLVTGSRTWRGHHTITYNLAHIHRTIGQFVLVHGACPRGADAIAAEWAREWAHAGITIEAHPADWQTHGKRAGFIRNTEMANSQPRPVICLAFIRDASRGATHCALAAQRSGIPLQVFTETTAPDARRTPMRVDQWTPRAGA